MVGLLPGDYLIQNPIRKITAPNKSINTILSATPDLTIRKNTLETY